MTCFEGHDFAITWQKKTPRTIRFVNLYILRNQKQLFRKEINKLRIDDYGLLHRRKFASFKINFKLINADNEILHPRCKVCDAKIKSNSTINFNSFSAGQKWAKFTTSNVYFISRQPFTTMWPIISHFKVYKMGFSEKKINPITETQHFFEKKS